MTDDELKRHIAKMYYMMGKFCKNEYDMIMEDINDFDRLISKHGYELLDGNTGEKYQLVLELKKVD